WLSNVSSIGRRSSFIAWKWICFVAFGRPVLMWYLLGSRYHAIKGRAARQVKCVRQISATPPGPVGTQRRHDWFTPVRRLMTGLGHTRKNSERAKRVRSASLKRTWIGHPISADSGHFRTHAPQQTARGRGAIARQSRCLCPVLPAGAYWGICIRFLRPQRRALRIAGEALADGRADLVRHLFRPPCGPQWTVQGFPPGLPLGPSGRVGAIVITAVPPVWMGMEPRDD